MISGGSSTFPIAIAPPATTVPANSAAGPSSTRVATATASTAITPTTTGSMPNRRTSRGATVASSPKHSTGSVVSTAAPAPESGSPSRISGSTGPTPATAGRRLTATTTTHNASSTGCRVRTAVDDSCVTSPSYPATWRGRGARPAAR